MFIHTFFLFERTILFAHNAMRLQSTSILQKCRQLLLFRLQIRVSSNVLLVDVNVWDGGLPVHLLESGLDSRSILCLISASMPRLEVGNGKHTDLIKLDGVELGVHLGKELLGGIAVWAVRLAEDGDCVLVAGRVC